MVLGTDHPATSTVATVLYILLQSSGVEGEGTNVLADHTYLQPGDGDVVGPVDPPDPDLPQPLSLSSLRGQPAKRQASPWMPCTLAKPSSLFGSHDANVEGIMSSDISLMADPVEQLAARLNEMENRVHDILAVVCLPKSLQSRV